MKNKVHLLFEQSGTFKKEFQKLGYDAKDYDIRNDFNETDEVIDLFDEIEKAYCYRDSIFDSFKKGELVMAFFPCIRFEDQIQMHFRGTATQYKKYTEEQKLQNDMKLHKELHDMYQYVTMLAIICIRGGNKLVIENPYSTTHYLTKYWSIPAKIIDTNRRDMGDYFKKPTQYWFINCEPQNNLVADPIAINQKLSVNNNPRINGNTRKITRSLISPQYAERFIKTYIVEGEKRKC